MQYFVTHQRNPVRFLTQGLLAVLGSRTDDLKIRRCGLVGSWIIFARSQRLVEHVTNSSKFTRFNPLNGRFSLEALAVTRALGMQPFLKAFLKKSIWLEPSGGVWERQRELFLSFVPKFGTRKSSSEIYKLLGDELERRVKERGPQTDLFDLMQEVVSVAQLKFISDYELPSRWGVQEYCALTNGAFGGLYAFQSPSACESEELAALCRHMLEHGGPLGLIPHMRKLASPGLSETEREEELLHNLMAGLSWGSNLWRTPCTGLCCAC